MRALTFTLLLALATAPLVAQSSSSSPRESDQPTTVAVLQGNQAPRPAGNIRLELTITDTYTGAPSAKTVTLLIENGRTGIVRTSNRLPSGMQVNLNVDANVDVISSGIRTRVTFEYTPAQSPDDSAAQSGRPAELNESLWVVLKDGQKTLVSQSADPATDRRVTVELMATRVD